MLSVCNKAYDAVVKSKMCSMKPSSFHWHLLVGPRVSTLLVCFQFLLDLEYDFLFQAAACSVSSGDSAISQAVSPQNQTTDQP